MKNKEAKSSPHQKGKFYFVKLDFASQNKEAKSSPHQKGSDFASQNKEAKSSPHQKGSDFASQNKEDYVKDFTETRSVCKYRR